MENITVIGGGLMGSSAAWHLSHKGERVLLLEQQGEQYKHGSSFGNSRISRSLGEKEDVFTYLQNRSTNETEKLIHFLNEVTKEQHQMTDIYTTSPVTYIHHKMLQQYVDKLYFEDEEALYKSVDSPKEALEKLGMKISDNDIIIREYKKYSGTLNPTALISKMQTGINEYGNRIQYHQKVLNIKRKRGHYKIELINNKTGEKSQIKTRKIVLAAGAYSASLLKQIAPSYKKLYRPQRMPVAFFKINTEKYNSYTNEQKTIIKNAFPVFNLMGGQFYSTIDKTDTDGLPVFKTGSHIMHNKVKNFDDCWAIKPKPDELEWIKKSFLGYLTMNNISINLDDIEYIDGYSCLYAHSITETPFVGNIKIKKDERDPNFVLVTAMSGIGAKGTMAYGLIAANILMQVDLQDPMYRKTKEELQLGDVLL